MRYSVFIALFFYASLIKSQSNYYKYHKIIHAAEDSLLEGRRNAAFEIYKSIFEEYDFVFPKDCLVAAEFAYYYENKDLSLVFLTKGFNWGLMPFHVLQCPIFKNIDKSFRRKMFDSYSNCRGKYLKKINVDALEKILNIRWRDQLYKNINPIYAISKNDEVLLDSVKSQNMDAIIQLCNKYGFPGQRVTGIVHNNILKELGRDSTLDLLPRYNAFLQKAEYYLNKEQFDLNSLKYLSNDAFIGALLHHPCAFQKLGKDFLIKSIKNGFIHPNDYGVLYEAEYCKCFADYKKADSAGLRQLCLDVEPYNGGYGTVVDYDKHNSFKIDENRKKIGMSTVEHRGNFYLFAEKKGIVVNFGYMEWK